MEDSKTKPEMRSDGHPGSVAQLHKYITKNTEYVMCGDRCVAVTKRGTSLDLGGSKETLQRARLPQLRALVRWTSDGKPEVLFGGIPRVGDSLLLGEEGAEVMTSVIRRVESVPGPAAEPA